MEMKTVLCNWCSRRVPRSYAKALASDTHEGWMCGRCFELPLAEAFAATEKKSLAMYGDRVNRNRGGESLS